MEILEWVVTCIAILWLGYIIISCLIVVKEEVKNYFK